MAGYNEILTGRYNRALQKLLSMKGPASTNELASIIYPSFSLFWGNEMRYLEQWALFGQAFSLAGAAGFNSVVRFRNGTPNVIAIFYSLVLSNPSAAAGVTINVEGPTPTLTDLATNISPFCTRFDKRGPQATVLNVSQDNTAAHANNGNTIAEANMPALAQFQFIADQIQELPLLPGDALQVRAPTVNTSLSLTAWWRERAMEDSELT